MSIDVTKPLDPIDHAMDAVSGDACSFAHIRLDHLSVP